MTGPAGATVRLRPLSVVEDGDDVLVGDPETGTFVAIPPVGAVVIAALRRGDSVAAAAREAEAFAGEPVDVPDFVATLRDLGFVETGPPAPAGGAAPGRPGRWARVLFGRTAWAVYAACALFDLAVLAVWPPARPDPGSDAFVFAAAGPSALVLTPFALAVMGVHECWHWLAARAAGVPARFGLDRRVLFLVFETDLSQLWTLPRRRRYGPLLAGLAVDGAVLSCLLAARLAGLGLPVLGAWSFVLVSHMVWQCMIFLRTDLYAVLVTATGCRDLWRVKTLLLRRAFGRLGPDGEAELAAAHPRDLRVGRWFRWLWLAGFGVVAGWAAVFFVPVVPPVVDWTAGHLANGPLTWDFWYGLGCAAVIFVPWAAVAALAGREYLGRLRLWIIERR
ncbi:hypothetical protein OHR68_17755 [Spirillospora sp. NBC_00431]